jgi:predicted small secreted protein
MMRLAVLAMLLCGMTVAGCTNTVRGFADDIDSDFMRNYNRDEASLNYNVRTDMEVDRDLGIDYESRTATEID